jgi:hypothetical protein
MKGVTSSDNVSSKAGAATTGSRKTVTLYRIFIKGGINYEFVAWRC